MGLNFDPRMARGTLIAPPALREQLHIFAESFESQKTEQQAGFLQVRLRAQGSGYGFEDKPIL